jgi:hypothetical protein
MFQPRFYRQKQLASGLVTEEVTFKESDLWIACRHPLKELAYRKLVEVRKALEEFIERFPVFQKSLKPIEIPENAPEIAKRMASAAQKAGVGPMAAVAGAIAQAVGETLLNKSSEVIVENGGDIYLKITQPRTIAIYAGESPFSQRIGLKLLPSSTPLGVCTSSGSVGHSFSFGQADAVVVLSQDTALADAAATATANLIHSENDVKKAVEWSKNIPFVKGVVAIKGKKMAAWGEIELTSL